MNNTHLDFWTAINIHKNILAVKLTSVVKLHFEDGGRQNRRNPGVASYAATTLNVPRFLYDAKFLTIQLRPTRGPIEGFVRPSLGFRCSKSILYSDNPSLFW